MSIFSFATIHLVKMGMPYTQADCCLDTCPKLPLQKFGEISWKVLPKQPVKSKGEWPGRWPPAGWNIHHWLSVGNTCANAYKLSAKSFFHLTSHRASHQRVEKEAQRGPFYQGLAHNQLFSTLKIHRVRILELTPRTCLANHSPEGSARHIQTLQQLLFLRPSGSNEGEVMVFTMVCWT